MANNKSFSITDNEGNDITLPSPLGKNSVSSLKVLFEDRDYYHRLVIPAINASFENQISFADLIKTESLYGLVDESLNIVLPIDGNMKEIASGDSDKKYVMSFVADAFNEMKDYLSKAAITGKINKNSVFCNLKAYRASVDKNILTNIVQVKLAVGFNKYALSNQALSAQIKDANTFNKKFFDYLKIQIKNNLPITLSSIVLSSNFSTFTSGLVIDIANDKADDDTIKYEKYFLDSAFNVFADACKRFGFKIDTNVPWRIMADLNSPAMKEKTGNHNGYMRRYNIGSVNELFNKKYTPTYLSELAFIREFFYKSYYQFVQQYPYYDPDYKKLDKCDFNNAVTGKRPLLTENQFYSLYPKTYWLRVYTYLRNYEEKRALTQQQFDNIVREANNFIKADREYSALEYINEYFKQFKNVHFLHSLQSTKDPVEQKIESNTMPDLVF